MINGYSLIFPEPLVACDGTEYYSCRAPDGEFALLVSCKDRQHYWVSEKGRCIVLAVHRIQMRLRKRLVRGDRNAPMYG